MIKRKLSKIEKMVDGKLTKDDYIDLEIKGISIDTRTIEKGQLFIPIVGENTDGHKYIQAAVDKGAGASLWNEDVPLPEIDFPFILVKDTTKALQDLASNYNKQVGAKVIGITGSNGKTSTKDIIASILETKFNTHKTSGNYNNEYGLPLTLLSMNEDTEMAVLEMGMSALGDIKLLCEIGLPDIGVITNSTDVHINDLGSVENILKAKMEIAQGVKDEGIIVHLGDSPPLKKAVEELDRNIEKISFGENTSNDYVTEYLGSDNEGIKFKVKDNELYLPMLGRHNIYNGAAAFTVAEHLGFSTNEIREAILNVDSTGLRNELVKGENFHVLNDAYKSNPTSLRFALETLYDLEGYKQKIVVLGDMFGTGEDEVENHLQIGKEIDPNQVDLIFTLGELGENFAKGAEKNFSKDRIYTYRKLKELGKSLKPLIKKDALILIKGSRILEMERILDIIM
ncbi:MAG TPA: UDP-N-acetylmuramoyl-tripeptide--D-alanyl-D-alanine ligase [Clostridiales bacterium]|jgi:UDP-N-acetylmuramoyl-tripeptide--D-alanyl-D-alanine ligase|nr:UDP-N-acetylmuramoyl-tripeptide--D-alanyl-D-alanine ligase [Clostridiales bacterium]